MKYTIVNKGEKATTDFINEDYLFGLFDCYAGYKEYRIVVVVIEPENDNACADHDTGFIYSIEGSINISEIEHIAWNSAWAIYDSYDEEAWVKMYGEMDEDEMNDWFNRDAKYVSEHYVVIDIDMSDEI